MSSRIAVDQFGSSVSDSNSSSKELNLHHTDKLYVNVTGDTLTGDLHVNGNKIYFDENKKNELAYREVGSLKFLQFKTVDGLAVTDPNDIVMCQFLRDGVQFNKKRLKNVGDPIDDKDAATKQYVNNRNEDLYMNENKLHFKNNIKIFNSGNDFVIEVPNKFIIKDSTNTLKLVLDEQTLHFNNRRLTNISDPINDNDATNKRYVDGIIKKKPKVYITNVKSGESKSFNTDNPEWYCVQINICINHDHQSIFILKSQANKIFNIRHKGDGIPGTSNYIYNYFGQVFISDVTDTNFVVNVKNFGYTNDIDLMNFRKRDNLSYYAVVSVVVL